MTTMLLSKTLNPPHPHSLTLTQFSNPQIKTPHFFKPSRPSAAKPFQILASRFPPATPSSQPPRRRDLRASAAKRDKTKYKARESAVKRVMNNPELREELRRRKRRWKNNKYAESFFNRLKNPHGKGNYPDNFTEDELQQIGLGYDRYVRFMDKDDPNLRHPFDWYKYGEFGPYSWRGVVLGDPVRGRFSDERVSMFSDLRDTEQLEKYEQFEMGQNYGKRLDEMDQSKFRYFWVFVRHPRWRLAESPWEQWTLVSEVVLEAGNQRLDKWNLMGRLGNGARASITKCAAWMRPDIIYVKKPIYQCRFEPQDKFFQSLMPFLDPKTEKDFMFELEDEDGDVELVTYFGGLCKIVRISPKAYVDDVVNAYEKLSDEKKSECLRFLLGNHPVHLLHPYTKEWKAKLEDLELGCDAPDIDDDDRARDRVQSGAEFVDWIEDDDDGDDDDDQDDDDDVTLEMEDDEDNEEDEKDEEEEELEEEKEKKQWEEEFRKAFQSSAGMEKLVKKSMETRNRLYGKMMREMKINEEEEEEEEGEEGKVEESGGARDGDGDETELRGKRAKVSPEEWKIAGIGRWRKRVKKSRIPPELFLRAAVRLFTYRNLVKEIVLTRHAILDGDISSEDRIL